MYSHELGVFCSRQEATWGSDVRDWSVWRTLTASWKMESISDEHARKYPSVDRIIFRKGFQVG